MDWDAIMRVGAVFEAARARSAADDILIIGAAGAPVDSPQLGGIRQTGTPLELPTVAQQIVPVIVVQDLRSRTSARGYVGDNDTGASASQIGCRFVAGDAGALIEQVRFDALGGAFIFMDRIGGLPAVIDDNRQMLPLSFERPSSVVTQCSRAVPVAGGAQFPFATTTLDCAWSLAPREEVIILSQVGSVAVAWSILWSEP